MRYKLAAKRMLGAVGRAFPRAPQRRLILLYHSIGHTPWAMAPDIFRAQMEWLVSMGALNTLEEVIRGDGTGALQVSITFDDGYVSLLNEAMPILSSMNAQATVFLNTGWIDDVTHRRSDEALGHYPSEHFLAWRDVKELVDNSWLVGSHGVEHLDLTRQSTGRVMFELVNSKNRIEEVLGGSCRGFAYTWGRNTLKLRNYVKSAGYDFALAATHGPLMHVCNPFAIPRINISTEYTLDDFKAIIIGDWDYLEWASILRNAFGRAQ